MNAFKAYDIRGVYGQDFNQEDVYKIGFFLPELLGTHGIWLALCLSELLTAVTIAVLFGLNMMRHRGMARQGRLL